jgi:hypothetical protein
MDIFKRLFGTKKTDPEHAVIVYFEYGRQDMQPVYDLGDALENAIQNAGVGEFDGNEMAADGSNGTFYMYGPDADHLFEVVLPVLKSVDFIKNATVRIRYGPPTEGVSEKTVKIER